jgi:hypothetical protein
LPRYPAGCGLYRLLRHQGSLLICIRPRLPVPGSSRFQANGSHRDSRQVVWSKRSSSSRGQPTLRATATASGHNGVNVSGASVVVVAGGRVVVVVVDVEVVAGATVVVGAGAVAGSGALARATPHPDNTNTRMVLERVRTVSS